MIPGEPPHNLDANALNYNAAKLIGPTAKFRKVWKTRFDPLTQSEGDMSVGFAGATLLSSNPIRHIVSNDSARILNRQSGSGSILEMMSACVRLGLFGQYVWCFTPDDAVNWIVRHGPVILGINWYESMMKPEDSGYLETIGEKVGRHAITASGYWPNHPKFGDVLVLQNHWGLDWGYRGVGYLPLAVFDRLFCEDAECTAPTDIPPRRTGSE